MKQPKVKIRHGDIEAEVSAKAAKAYERNGWTVVDDGSSESDVPVAEAAPVADPVPASEEPSKKTTSRKAE